MSPTKHFILLFLTSLSCFSNAAPTDQYCKPQPGDRHWPSQSAWQSLNASVSGRLYVPVPPGSVCHPSWPQFDNATCKEVTKRWVNTEFHILDPVSVDYNDETCLPDPLAPCSAAGYPSYVIEAESAKDVQHGVVFVHETGVRLVVKGTGHDFPGRSSGPDSLSIYTHKLRGIEIVDELDSSSATKPAAHVKIHTGERMHDIMKFAADNKLTAIGGADPHVGIGGWISGGGHGPLTVKYGMGADQVVEMQVVTADGVLRTVNADCEPDLFWALRGSGGSTFAVTLSVTVKMYPSISLGTYLFSYNTTSDSDTFWSMNAYFHSQLPRLADAGISSYYYVFPLSPMQRNASMQGQLAGEFLGAGLAAKDVAAAVAPMEKHFQNAGWGDPIYGGGYLVDYPDFSKYWATQPPQDAGFSGRLGSRLLDEKALTGDMGKLKLALKKTTPIPWNTLGHLVAGPGTHSPPDGIPGGSNAVGPAWRKSYTHIGWRKSYTHIVLPRVWPFLNQSAKTEVTTLLRDVQVEALRELAPDTGAYVNEVDPTEPNWHETLYGENYDRLLETKKKWDPKGTFWCKHCIGSDLWETLGPDGIENGVGQSLIKLCRK